MSLILTSATRVTTLQSIYFYSVSTTLATINRLPKVSDSLLLVFAQCTVESSVLAEKVVQAEVSDFGM